MKPRTATRRRHLATSPFAPPEEPPPIEPFVEDERVVHDRYGLGRVVDVEGDTAVVVDFGNARVRITGPALAKLTRL